MIFYWIIFILISISAFRNWKTTTLFWVPLQLLFNEAVCLKYTPPALTLVFAVNVILFAAYFLSNKNKTNNGTYFFYNVFIFYLISHIISLLFSVLPVSSTLSYTIRYFVDNFGALFLFYKALTNLRDIKFVIRIYAGVIVLMVLLGLFESLMRYNPILDFIYFSAPSSEYLQGKLYYRPFDLRFFEETGMRFNMYRAYSFFNIHIAFGSACALLFFFFMQIKLFDDRFIPSKILTLVIFLLIVGVLLSNSKTPIVGMLFFILAFFSIKSVKQIKLLFFVLIGFFLIYIYMPNYFNNLFALFDSKIAEDGGGSNLSMRERQFAIGLELFLENPIFGNGLRSTTIFSSTTRYADLLGSESSLLKILPERGIFGLLTYIYLYKIMFGKLIRVLPIKRVIYFLCGLLAMEIATGFMYFPLYGAIVICIYKYYLLKKMNHE